MLSSVYLKTLRDLREQILVWGLGLAGLGAVNLLLFPTFAEMPGLIAFLDNLPPALKAFVGDVQALTMREGFMEMKLFDPLPLLLSVFGVTQGAGLLAGEAEGKTIDLLMSQPVRRWRVVLEKYLAVVTGLALILALMAAGLVISSLFTPDRTGWTYLVAASFTAMPLTLLFSALALLGSCTMSRARRAALVAGGFVVASYTLEPLRMVSPALAGWKSVSLFAHHKDAFEMTGEIGWMQIGSLTGIAAVLLVAAMAAYERKDLAG